MSRPTAPRMADHPEHQKLSRRIQELDAERAVVAKRLAELARPDAAQPSKAVEARHRAAVALLEGAPLESSPATTDSRAQERDALQRRDIQLEEAVRLGRRMLDELEARLSPAMAVKSLGVHREAVARIAKLLVDLGEALEVEAAIRDDLEANGVRYLTTIRPMGLPVLGGLRDRESPLRKYLAEAAEYGVKVPRVHDTEARPFRPIGPLALAVAELSAAARPGHAEETDESRQSGDSDWTPTA